jgi:hypothetical protein
MKLLIKGVQYPIVIPRLQYSIPNRFIGRGGGGGEGGEGERGAHPTPKAMTMEAKK